MRSWIRISSGQLPRQGALQEAQTEAFFSSLE
jgi:hypothetical protein